MTWDNKIERELCDKFEALLEEAKEKGYCFEFNTECQHASEFRKYDLLTIYTDDDTFTYDLCNFDD